MLEGMEYLESPLEFVDLTNRGRCSNCGECCHTNFLPMNEQEVARIKRYIKKYRITDSLGYAPMVSKWQSMDYCPFRDEAQKRCKLYPVRPEICRRFLCNLEDEVILQRRTEAHERSWWTERDLRATFFGAEPLFGAEVIKFSA